MDQSAVAVIGIVEWCVVYAASYYVLVIYPYIVWRRRRRARRAPSIT